MAPLERFRITHLSRCASTNTEIKRAIDGGEPARLVIRSDIQTGGYGRRGHAWTSPAGGLYFSCLLRPRYLTEDSERAAAELSTIGLVAAIAVRRTLERFTLPEVAQLLKLKWPNDVILEAKSLADSTKEKPSAFQKLCGISQEIHHDAVCLGIGINVFRPTLAEEPDGSRGQSKSPVSTIQPESARNAFAYLEDIAVAPADLSLDEVFEVALMNLEEELSLWEQEGFAGLVSEYTDAMALLGTAVRLVDGSRVLGEGIISGITDSGALLLRNRDSGEVRAFQGGHVLVL